MISEIKSEDWLQEFELSAIPDDLTLSNVEWVDGSLALEILTDTAAAKLQKNIVYVTTEVAKLLRQYEPVARDGGWVAYGTTLNGEPGTVAYFKPDSPRKDTSKGFGQLAKLIKYETPAGCPALPLQPFIPDKYLDAICERFAVPPSGRLEGETAWQLVQRLNLPIIICEGLKKALALIAQGIPAIAIRGITQWSEPREKTSIFSDWKFRRFTQSRRQRHSPPELCSILKDFATPGRTVYVCFDQDEKEATRRNVQAQARKLGQALENAGCQVYICQWDKELGKGIDDALYNIPEDERSYWLDDVLDNAKPFKKFRRELQKAQSFQELKTLEQLTYPVERATSGDYLPELPPMRPGAIHVISSDTNAGKTTRIGQDWVRAWIALGGLVVVVSPLNSLGRQTGNNWDLPHIHDFQTDKTSQEALEMYISYRGGIILCPDSLHRLPHWIWQRPVLVILDEANQVLEHLTQGDTLKHRWDSHNRLFAELTQKASAIVASEANLPDRAVKFLQRISGKTDVRVFTHKKISASWNVTVYDGGTSRISGFLKDLLAAIGAGERVCIPTTSKAFARRISRLIREMWPDKKVSRVDSDTNEKGAFTQFFENPDEFLKKEQPDVLIFTPSVKSGVSIEGEHFDSVWAYFPSLTSSTHLQLLGRVRQDIPRNIFVPELMQIGFDEYPKAWIAKHNTEEQARQLAGAFGLSEHLESSDNNLQNAIQDYLAESKAVAYHQKQISRDWLSEVLTQAGHHITLKTVEQDRQTREHFKAVKENLWREDSVEFAGLEIQPHQDKDWAATLESGNTTRLNRLRAQKILRRDEFPGITWDDAEDCYEALIKEHGRMMKGVKLECHARNLAAIKAMDKEQSEQILKGSELKAYHRLPRQTVKAALIAETGVLGLVDQPYDNDTPLAQEVKAWALKRSKEIYQYFRLTITPNQSPVQIVNKLLKKLGFEPECKSREGSRGERLRQYQVKPPSELRERLVEKYSITLKNVCPQLVNNPSITTCGHINISNLNSLPNVAGPPPPLDVGWHSQAC